MPADAEADRLIRRGAELSAAGAPEAQELLEQAVSLAPEDPDILVRAASLSFDNERYERARELLVRAREVATPDFDLVPTMAFVGGLLLLREGRRDEALQLLQGAFDTDPARRGHGYTLAIELLRAGRTRDARAVVAQARDSGAPDEDLLRLGEHLDAIAVAEEAHAAGEEPADALVLADALSVFAPERGRAVFESVLQTGDGGQRAIAAFNLGSLLDESDPAAAQRYYEQAMASDDPEIRGAAAFNLGGMLLADDPVQARGFFEQASQSPDAGVAALAREQLAALG